MKIKKRIIHTHTHTHTQTHTQIKHTHTYINSTFHIAEFRFFFFSSGIVLETQHLESDTLLTDKTTTIFNIMILFSAMYVLF